MQDKAKALLGRGIYTVTEASQLTDIEPARLLRWLRGYEFKLGGEKRKSDRVIHGELPVIEHSYALSFLDLQEARCIAEFRKRKVGWPALRAAHGRAREAMQIDHPFSTGEFKTVGRRVMWDAANEEGDAVLLDVVKNQTTFRLFLAPYLRGLEFLNDQPVKWFPLPGSKRVVVDPQRAFGRPIVTKRGVPTDIIARAYRAEKSYIKVSRWYEVDLPSVRDAVRFEHDLAA